MPSPRVLDLTPPPRTEETGFEKFLGGAVDKYKKNMAEKEESDALKDIYEKYKTQGKDIEEAIMDVSTRPGISPTTRVNQTNTLLELRKQNAVLQKETAKQNKADEEAKVKKAQNQKIIADIEKRAGEEPGALAAYEDNPAMAERLTRPKKENQANKPLNEDQLKRIEQITAQPAFMEADLPSKNLMLIKGGVSKENTDAVMKPITEQAKLNNERPGIINKKQAEADFAFVQEQVGKEQQLFAQQQNLEAADALNEKGVTGGAWDAMMQRAGLLQFTNEGYREFASYAKEALKTAGIKDTIGSQISLQEFKFFQEATINERFSKEANRRILKKEMLAVRYKKLYGDITLRMVQENGGLPPERVQQKVNEEFKNQSKKITKQLKKEALYYDMIQFVPKGFVLMYDKKRIPLHVPDKDVSKAAADGATLQ